MTPAGGRRRVLVVTTWFPSSDIPTQAPFNLKHAEAISTRSDVTVVHVRLLRAMEPRRERYAGVSVIRAGLDPRRPLAAAATILAVRRLARQADLVHSMAFSSALVTALATAFTRTSWVHTEHWNGVVKPASVSRAWVALAGLRWVLRLPGWLTGVTTQLSSTLASFGSTSTTSVVPCVVQNPLPVRESTRGGPLRLVAVGGLVERKRPMLALQTLAWLVGAGEDVVISWVGDGPLRGAIEAEAGRLGLQGRFTITGFVNPDDVFAHLDDAQLFFLPTEQENFFTSAAEALSAGRPVVAPRVGGFEDYAQPANSVLVDVATPESLGAAILVARDRFAGVPADQIAAPIRERFSLERVAAQFEEIYEAVAPRVPRVPRAPWSLRVLRVLRAPWSRRAPRVLRVLRGLRARWAPRTRASGEGRQ